MRYILYAILIYIAYQFLFNLVVPVYKTTRKIKKGFREMSARMNQSDGHEQMNKQQANSSNGKQWEQSAPKKEEKGDYIDFEEVK